MSDAAWEAIPNRYDPKTVEEKWYGWWEQNGYFRPQLDRLQSEGLIQTQTAEQREEKHQISQQYSTIKNYCITIPPPNVTGNLHMGHALNHSVIDALIRLHRMRGENTLCIPGTDHAGIATQNVVEKQLRKEGANRHSLGREGFVDRVWEWVNEYGTTIIQQLRSLGCSYDWDRLRFTLDKEYADAVLEMFTRWWSDGLLYLGSRVVNWCPRCQSVISDIEVAAEDRNAQLYHIRYQLSDGSGHIVVATTRPETMLGDIAVAVHPSDERYKNIVGKTVIVPLLEREIRVIADEYPDPEFGSGAVKITPAHDPNDFEVGQRHKLSMPVILARDASVDTSELREEAKISGFSINHAYLETMQGMDRYAARDKIVEELKAGDHIETIEPHRLTIGTCDRCHTVIEPLLSEQWFCDMSSISKPAIEVVQEDKIKFIPERYKPLYINWMENLRDWPISRQLWWGHQIPAYYCKSCHPEDFLVNALGEMEILKRRDPIVSKTPPTNCEKCNSDDLIRDPWVLDTWFSSSIWPQTVMGWPRETEDLQRYYPTNVLTTDKGIINLWVARMIMTGLYFTKEIPFKEVYVHATVMTASGQRMSKSLGTGIDPIELIEKYGADATRWALLGQAGMNQDLRFSDSRVEAARNFCNKLWNASRFVMLNLNEEFTTRTYHDRLPDKAKLTEIDRWIISRFVRTVKLVSEAIDGFQMDETVRGLYEFFWNEFCDWYIEAVKPRLLDENEKRIPQTVLTYLLERTIRLMHPLMPFLTEEIWNALPHTGETVSLAAYPEYDEALVDAEAEKSVELLQEITRGLRNLRAEIGMTPGQKMGTAFINPTSDAARVTISQNEELLRTFAWLNEITISIPSEDVKRIATTVSGADLFLPTEGVIDSEKEIARLQKEHEKVSADIAKLTAKLSNPQFIERAPAEVVEKDKALIAEHESKLVKIVERIKTYGG